MEDIQHKAQIEQLVEVFYAKVFKNATLAPFFEGMDFEAHKPQMVHFWSFVLINEPGYTTNVTEKHLKMPLKEEHFRIWLQLFQETVSELFEGDVAEMAKQRASIIAWTIGEKINHQKD